MEPTEISEFVEDVEKGGEAKLTHVSLAISILAVLVAMVTVLGHRAHTEAVLVQSRSADQWNEYQSRKLRVHEDEIAKSALLLQLPLVGTGINASHSDAIEAKAKSYEAEIAKWQPELDAAAEKAKDLETDVTKIERSAGRFDLGEALLQIAVVLSSITLLTRQQRYFALGLLLGLAGTAVAAFGLVR